MIFRTVGFRNGVDLPITFEKRLRRVLMMEEVRSMAVGSSEKKLNG